MPCASVRGAFAKYKIWFCDLPHEVNCYCKPQCTVFSHPAFTPKFLRLRDHSCHIHKTKLITDHRKLTPKQRDANDANVVDVYKDDDDVDDDDGRRAPRTGELRITNDSKRAVLMLGAWQKPRLGNPFDT